MQQNNQHNAAYRPRIRLGGLGGSQRIPWIIVSVLLVILLWPPVLEPALSAFTAPWRLTSEIAARQQATAVAPPAQRPEHASENGASERPSAELFTGTQVLVNGQPVGVVNPQTQIGHPPFYLETGVTGSQRWAVSIPQGAVLIVGGMIVDGRAGGVYKALSGGATHEVTVTNGFALVTTQEWARDEFCFRLGQAKQYGWAHGTVLPLSGWQPCSDPAQPTVSSVQGAQSTPQATPVSRERVPTGVGQSRTFQAGDTVWGFEIRLGGNVYRNCVLRNAPVGGAVTDGVINPTEQEIASATPCRSKHN